MGRMRMRSLCGGVLLATALSLRAGCPANAQAISPATRESGVDPSIRPGDDFFAWANGGWLTASEIPAGKERWTARTEIGERTRQRLVQLLDAAAGAPAGSLGRKVADFRSAWLNINAIEARGLAPLKPYLDSIDRVPNKAALIRLLGRGVRADVDPLNWGVYRSSTLFGLSVEPSIHGEARYVAFLLQGGLGLPDRADYVSTQPEAQALRTRYQEYVARLLGLAGYDRADQRAAELVALETALARTQATPEASANDHNADNRWTMADFTRRAPGIDWPLFFAAAGLSREEAFVAWQPTAVTGAAELVGSQLLETWKDYLRFHALHANAEVLPAAFANAASALREAVGGQPPPGDRTDQALAATHKAMSGAVGRLYAERYFPPEQKARVESIAANVIAAFRRRVEAAKWMSPATRTQALAKLKTLYFGIGYPDQWPDYSDLVIDSTDPVGNLQRVRDRDYRQAVARLGQPVDLRAWWIAPQTVGAVLVFQQNSYNFPAALLQAPKYDPSASDAANYGAIGAIFGHEVSHTVDLLGAEWDQERRLHHWWTPEDRVRFQVLADPLAKQFSSYRPFPDLAVNGTLTQTENIADLAGLSAAFDAYRSTLGARAVDQPSLRQQDREFFLGFARSWRSRIRDEALRTQLTTDGHAPERYRIATVRNIDAWYDAFDVQPGQRLYLEPGARVRAW